MKPLQGWKKPSKNKQVILSLAPLHGYTDKTYRTLLNKHFGGVDRIYAPFISPSSGKISTKLFKDFQENDVPQLLGKDGVLLANTAQLLQREGWNEVNLNLGCPVHTVAAKGRGSGLLPHPDLIRKILEEVHRGASPKWSVKLRLGRKSDQEFPALVEVLKDFPLTEVILHPRTGVQLYTGAADWQALKLLQDAPWPVQLSGDVFSKTHFDTVKNNFPWLKGVFLGRGLCANPFLAEEIKASPPKTTPPAQEWERFWNFYQDFQQERALLLPQYPLVLHKALKAFWLYPCGSFIQGSEWYKRLVRSNSLEEYQEQVQSFKFQSYTWSQEGQRLLSPYTPLL